MPLAVGSITPPAHRLRWFRPVVRWYSPVESGQHLGWRPDSVCTLHPFVHGWQNQPAQSPEHEHYRCRPSVPEYFQYGADNGFRLRW
ncbi:hypothetical protein YPPY92_2162 [Yersinia pestis PY-92]|nr:hypothetical protein YPPY92_2162 [Yersinia pestis PY-92]